VAPRARPPVEAAAAPPTEAASAPPDLDAAPAPPGLGRSSASRPLQHRDAAGRTRLAGPNSTTASAVDLMLAALSAALAGCPRPAPERHHCIGVRVASKSIGPWLVVAS
jgi:hypothetical protein